LKVSPNFDAISQKSSALVHQISTLIFNNTDLLILTFFTNLKVVSVYVMYNLIFSNIDRIIGTVNNSFTFALGQNFHEKKEKFIKFYDTYEVFFMAFVFSLFSIAFILILPFMKLYTLHIDDVNYLDPILPILFVILKLLNNARTSSNNVIFIAGHFKSTQYRSILESTINLFFSIVFVTFLGIYGVLLGTICALLYRSTDMIIYANKVILKRNPIVTFRRWLINIGVFTLIVLSNSYYSFFNLTSYTEILIWGMLLSLVIFPIYIFIGLIFEKEVYYLSKDFCKRALIRFKRRLFKVYA
ncbi:sugar isomerase, partial [Gottfriedia sp. NPDC056225]